MMLLVRIVAGLHLAAYLGIMWYGWQSYKLLRKRSWRYMGIGFFILLLYRTRQFVEQLLVDYRVDTGGTLLSFIGAVLLFIAFRKLWFEHQDLFERLATDPGPMRSGAQPVEFWLEKVRLIVREEIAAVSATTTVTVKGPSSVATADGVEVAPD